MKKKSNRRPESDLVDRLLIIDGSNLAHRAYRKFANISTKDHRNTGIIYGFLRILQTYLVRWNPTYAIVVFDSKASKESNYRLKLLPTYKSHRSSLEIDYLDFEYQIRVVKKFLKWLGVPYIYDKKGLGHEADDYIAWIAKRHKGHVTIVTTDKDFCQLLDSFINIYNPFLEKTIRVKNCRDIMEYEAKETVDWLTLVGDTSDDIPGYKGIGPKKTRDFLDQFGSIPNFLSDPKNKFKGIDRDTLRTIWKRNTQIISLFYANLEFPITWETIPLQNNVKQKRTDRLETFFKKYELYSFMTKEFREPFKQLKPWQPTKSPSQDRQVLENQL